MISPILCYRQLVAFRYVLISVLAVTFVVLVAFNEPDQEVSHHFDFGVLERAKQSRPIHNNHIQVNSRGQGSTYHSSPTLSDECTRRRPSLVILLTYGRSGSSLTADILQHHPDVFYHYEPLHNLAKTFTKQQMDYRMSKGGHLHLTSIPKYNQAAEDILDMFLTCNYTHLPSTAYKNLHLARSSSTKPLNNCVHRANDDARQIEECLKINSERCKIKPIQFIKTIRLTTESVGHLMSRHPKLKMIYLVRDPRGSYLSKLKAFPGSFSKNATIEADRICPRYEKDIDHAFKLRQKYPNRVTTIRYETISEDPVETSRILYKFLCMDFNSDIQKYITHAIMHGTNQTEKDIYSVRRQDSKAASYSWRTRIPMVQVLPFDDACSTVYTKLGYLPVGTERNLRDLDLPLKTDVENVL